ncbi:LLM class flavin-dependent oxidoreductase (plasmid) [Shinella yambaruensis]|uniref:LLM class flavin-dependent oxidoreductase n=1 Tax=Shinella yambaruensis TaxID=415996 RepID=UPI003D7B8732
MSSRKIVLGTILYPSGHHVAAWRHPSTRADANITAAHYIDAARAAEAAGFEIAFISDRLGVPKSRAEALRRVDEWSHGFEALTLAAAVATATTRIGVVATASTTFNEPYNLARQLASLDLISNGRIGWNIVTSSLRQESDNFNPGPDFDHAARYARADEFVDAVLALWGSWNPDGFVRDKQSGVFFEPDAVKTVDYEGRYFRSKGPLNVIPSRQGRPLLVQAGSSDSGKALAAKTADVVFTAQTDIVSARSFYQDIRKRRTASGKRADDVLILPGIFPVIGRTTAEAEDKYAELQDLIQPDVALSLLETYLGDVDLSGVDIDGPLPDLPVSNSIRSRQVLLTELARTEGLTVGALARRIAGARGHWQVIGTAEDIAGQIEDWTASGAADGFMLLPPTFPEGQDDFIRTVVPLLRERGLLNPGPQTGSLRERLALPPLARNRPFEAGRNRA